MSRSAWSETREPEPSRAGGGAAGSSDTRDVDRHASCDRARPDVRRTSGSPCTMRDRVYRLRESEWHTLRTVGTFRVVAEADLLRDAGDQKTMRNDLLHLVDEGLARPEDRHGQPSPDAARSRSRRTGRPSSIGIATPVCRAGRSSTTPAS